jgi:hypothetical protein
VSDFFVQETALRQRTYGTIDLGRLGTISFISSNTKGTFWQLTQGVPFPVDLFGFSTFGQQPNHYYLLDFALGSTGSEQVFLANIPFNNYRNANAGLIGYVPISLPENTPISVRGQCSTTGDNLQVAISVMSAGMSSYIPRFSRVHTFGAITSGATKGTLLAASGTVNVNSAWVQVTAGVTEDVKGMVVIVGCPPTTDNRGFGAQVTVGIGTAGNEVPLLFELHYNFDRFGGQVQQFLGGPYPVSIPQGTRLSARQRNTDGRTGIADLDIVLLCFS